MTLNEIITAYALMRSLSRGAAYLLRWSVASFAKHLGHEPTIADLCEDAVSQWLAGLQAAPATRAEHRTHLLTVWRYAAGQGLCRPPGDVRREKIPEPQREAWTLDEVGRLMAACDRLPEGGEYLRV
jgi:integrase